MLSMYKQIIKRSRRDFDEYRETKKIKKTMDTYEEANNNQNSTEFQKGNMTYNAIRENLEKFDTIKKYRRSPDQVRFHMGVIEGLAAFIYKSALRDNEYEIMEYNGFDSLKHITFLTMPRRGGKTFATVMLICVLLMCVERIRIFSIGPTMKSVGADSGIMIHVKKMLREVFGVTSFYKSNTDVLIIRRGLDERSFRVYSAASGDKYVLFSRPSTKESLVSFSLLAHTPLSTSVRGSHGGKVRPGAVAPFSNQIGQGREPAFP